METKVSSQNSRIGWIALGAILLLASILRLYRIADYMTFLGDEGRDVLIVKHLLEGDLVGLGPTASVGGFFTGPIYYYFMAPFLWLFRLDPVGPAVMVGLFGIATVFLVYFVGKEFFNTKAGLFAAALYAVSPLVIAYSRSSWNPNPLPFFSLLAVLFVYKGVERASLKYFLLSGIMLGVALQLHYIATFLAVIIAVYILLSVFTSGESLRNPPAGGAGWTPRGWMLLKRLTRNYLAIFGGFLVGYSPFLLFEATHGFPNTVTVLKFIFGGTGETGFTGERFVAIVSDVAFRLFGRFLTRFPPLEQITLGKDTLVIDSYGVALALPLSLLYSATVLLLVASIALVFSSRVRARLLVLLWLGIGIFLFGFYRKPIYDYYFGFMSPLPFLLVGMMLAKLSGSLHVIGKIAAVTIFIFLMLLNFDGMPFRYAANRQLAQVRHISEVVLEKAEGRLFNFALITSGNSDHAYRYFFELEGNPPVTIQNPQVDPGRTSVTDQLLVVCESLPCAPLGHSLFEVAGFGQAEIIGEWSVSVVRVYKLVHYDEEQ